MPQGVPSTAKIPVSLRLPADLISQLDGRPGSRTESVERDLERYYQAIAHEKKYLLSGFSEGELNLIMDACNGWPASPEVNPQLLWAGVSDAIDMDGLAEKWSVADAPGFIQRLRALTPIQQFALHDALMQFWARDGVIVTDSFGAELKTQSSRSPLPRG